MPHRWCLPLTQVHTHFHPPLTHLPLTMFQDADTTSLPTRDGPRRDLWWTVAATVELLVRIAMSCTYTRIKLSMSQVSTIIASTLCHQLTQSASAQAIVATCWQFHANMRTMLRQHALSILLPNLSTLDAAQTMYLRRPLVVDNASDHHVAISFQSTLRMDCHAYG